MMKIRLHADRRQVLPINHRDFNNSEKCLTSNIMHSKVLVSISYTKKKLIMKSNKRYPTVMMI